MAKHPGDNKTLDLLDQAGSALQSTPSPANPLMTWTGCGRKPQWVLDWLAGGCALDDLLIDQVEVKKQVLEVISVCDPAPGESLQVQPVLQEQSQARRGRPSRGEKPMTAAERKRASREARRARVIEFSEDESDIVWHLVRAQFEKLKREQAQQGWHPDLLARHQSILDKVSTMTGVKQYTKLKSDSHKTTALPHSARRGA